MGFGKSIKEILRFELIWKLAVLGLVSPLFREIYQTYVASVGVSFNQDMLGTFLNLKGGLLFLLLFLGVFFVRAGELTVGAFVSFAAMSESVRSAIGILDRIFENQH